MEIEKLAKLARINLSSQEKEKLQKEFEAILGYISILKEADVGVGGLDGNFPKRETLNVMRMDENFHEAGKLTKELLEDAPFIEEGYVKVKHVFE